MSTIDSVVAVTVNGQSVSLADAMKMLHADGKLDFLNTTVRSVLIRQIAQREGLAADDAELQAEADALRLSMGLSSAADTEAWLAKNHMTVDDLEDRVERAILTRKLKDKATEAKLAAVDGGELDAPTRATIQNDLFEAWLAEEAFKADIAFNLLGELTGGR